MRLNEGIQLVKQEDFNQVAAVWEASVRATHHFVSENDIAYFKTLVRDGIPSVPDLVCVKTVEGAVAGFLGASGAKIEMLFVHPEWIGQGIGRRLVEHAVNVFSTVEVDVNEQNAAAVGFYQHLGFETFERSALDSTGKPYPILHMRLRDPANESRADLENPGGDK